MSPDQLNRRRAQISKMILDIDSRVSKLRELIIDTLKLTPHEDRADLCKDICYEHEDTTRIDRHEILEELDELDE